MREELTVAQQRYLRHLQSPHWQQVRKRIWTVLGNTARHVDISAAPSKCWTSGKPTTALRT
jgi:hypothetical protein